MWFQQVQGETTMVEIHFCGAGLIFVTILLFLFTLYAYLVNKGREPNDPGKKDLELAGILFIPLWPAQFLFGLVVTLIKAVLYGVCLLVFTAAVVLIRKPFFWRWIEKPVLQIGTKILEVNTFLIRLFFPKK
jgi:hypothetical protein